MTGRFFQDVTLCSLIGFNVSGDIPSTFLKTDAACSYKTSLIYHVIVRQIQMTCLYVQYSTSHIKVVYTLLFKWNTQEPRRYIHGTESRKRTECI